MLRWAGSQPRINQQGLTEGRSGLPPVGRPSALRFPPAFRTSLAEQRRLTLGTNGDECLEI